MTAIEFENVSKQYRLGLVGTQTLAHDLRRFWITNIRGKEDPYLKIGETNDRATKGNSDYVWALRDINFKVEQGDVLGIIGKNGAGKSTLLKLLSRVTGPTTGAIRARGRIGSLLEVGTGFHPEMTGRENIYMNGAILGMTRREIDRKLDEIIDFSGCERYIDTPVKRYSSGMTVRLGFAVAAHLEPEILVVDEVLAVGDIEFQKKAIGKMKDVSRGEGRTVLFVSHNMASVRSLCTRGMVLEKGSVAFDGDVNEAVEKYMAGNISNSENFSFDNLEEAPGNDRIRIKSFKLTPTHGSEININSGISVEMVVFNNIENALLDATFELRTLDDTVVFHQGTFFEKEATSKIGYYRISMNIPPQLLNAGTYNLRVWFGQNTRYLVWGTLNYGFDVRLSYGDDGFAIGARPGIIHCDLDMISQYH